MDKVKNILIYISFGLLIGIVAWLSVANLRLSKEAKHYAALIEATKIQLENNMRLLNEAQQEVEKLSYENITKMDPADVVDRYLNDVAKQSLLAGADKYTALIVGRVFEWLRGTVLRDQELTDRIRAGNSEGAD